MAQENRSWGYDRIVGALANLGYTVSDQTVGNILKRHGVPPAPERKTTTTWKEFIRTHMDILVATDFFTAEVWTLGGLVTYYVLFFIHLGSRKVHIAGMTPHPNAAWMVQVARNLTRSYWIPGSYAPALSENGDLFSRLLKNKDFKEEKMTKVELYISGESTTLESNKSL